MVEELHSEALRLSDAARVRLADDLLQSLDAPAHEDIAEAWDQELCRRLDAIDAGTAERVDRDELRRRLQARIERG